MLSESAHLGHVEKDKAEVLPGDSSEGDGTPHVHSSESLRSAAAAGRVSSGGGGGGSSGICSLS